MQEKKYRYLLEIQYLGAQYKGWQKQKNYPNQTIQDVLEKKIAILLRHNIDLFAAGRTDSKVNARAQFAHFDTYFSIDRIKFLYNLNALLKNETICVKNIIICEQISDIQDTSAQATSTQSFNDQKFAKQIFHARFSCKQKTYKYYMLFEKTKDIFSNTYWHLPNMDGQKFLQQANICAQFLLDTHDFASFQDSDCQAKSSIKTIDKCIFLEEKSPSGAIMHVMEISARSFLQHQVRIIIGTIVEIIKNDLEPLTLKLIMEKRDRKYAGMTAPAQGLFLDNIIY